MPDQIVPYLVRMPATLHQAMKDRAAEERRSLAETVRIALETYLNGPK